MAAKDDDTSRDDSQDNDHSLDISQTAVSFTEVSLLPLLARGEREIDVAGRVVTPGGIDAHCHLDQPMAPPVALAISSLR